MAHIGNGIAAINAALDAGDTSCEALLDEARRAIDAGDSAINAVISQAGEGAVAAARAADERRRRGAALSPIDGLPFGVKDNIHVAGLVTSGGLRRSPDAAPESADAPAVAALRAAGAIPLAKLHLHEAALGASSHNSHFGDCHNPLRAGYSPGGSSGGSAAAVAAGYFPFTLGTDTMGSVRIPAAYCGLVGLKPSHDRISGSGMLAACPRLDSIGPLAATLDDLDLLLPILEARGNQGADLRRRLYPAREQDAPLPENLRLRYPADLAGLGVEAPVQQAFEGLLQALAAAGHRLEAVSMGATPPGRYRRAGLALCEAHMLAQAPPWMDYSAMSPELRELLDWIRGKSALDLARADAMIDQGASEFLAALATADAWLSPTTPQLAFPMAGVPPPNQADLTLAANMAGLPALSLPLPTADPTRPAGAQLVGHAGDDYRLLGMGRVLARDSAGLLRETRLPLPFS